jgi:hypothetical protein
MDADNMERWESKMTASERRIVTTQFIFIFKSMGDIMTQEYHAMRVRSFEKTGCSLTWLPNNQQDEKKLPRGMAKGMFQVQKVRKIVDLIGPDLPELMEPEVAAIAEEQAIIDENEGDGNLDFDGGEDNGSIIDDNPEI